MFLNKMFCQSDEKQYLKNLIFNFYNYSTKMNPEDVKQLTWDDQKIFLEATVNHSLLKKYPVNSKFAILYLKRMLLYLEQELEVHDDFYRYICSYMKNEENDEFCYRHYVIYNDINTIITMKETKNIVVNGTTGMRTWEAAIVLADWSLSNKNIFSEKNVLELGSGIGFTGITMAKYCDVKSLYLSDCHEDVLNTICQNIEINFPMEHKIEQDITTYLWNNHIIGVIKLDWNSFTIPTLLSIVPDVVIGADIVYDPSILPVLCNVFEKLFTINNNLYIYIASVIRNDKTHDLFLEILEMKNYSVKIVDYENPINIHWNHNIRKKIICIKSNYNIL